MNHEIILAHEKFGAQNIVKHAQQKADYIFEGLIEKGDQWIISGAPKSGKSRLALQLAISASEGQAFLGYECPEKQKVLYIDLELSPRVSSTRILSFYDYDSNALLKNEYLFVCSDYKQIDVNSTSDCAEIQKLISLIHPDLIIWDVLARMHAADENSNIAMLQVMQNIRRLSKDTAHVVVHHARKEAYGNGGAKSIRGASSIHGEADGVMAVAFENTRKGSHSIMFSTRAVETPDKVWMNSHGLEFIPASFEQVEDSGQSSQDLIKCIFVNDTPLKRSDLLKEMEAKTKLGSRQIERKLNELGRLGLITKFKLGREVFYKIQS